MRSLLRATLTTILAATVLSCGGMNGHSDEQNLAAGKTKLESGIDLARVGIAQYQAGETATGLDAIDYGRGLMGQGMVDMGFGCCIGDGSPATLGDGSAAGSCASSMGPGVPAMVQGLTKFDGARGMMGQGDAAAMRRMMDMEAAMQMMEQGSKEMLGSGGEMGGMM
jgi:hypothetical protein